MTGESANSGLKMAGAGLQLAAELIRQLNRITLDDEEARRR